MSANTCKYQYFSSAGFTGKVLRLAAAAAFTLLSGAPALAHEDVPDEYPQSVLYSKPVEVIPGVWSAIGSMGPPTYENSGHNNNLSFIVTGAGVVVINGGAGYQVARALHDEIRQITDEPVRLVINENGQGHSMLGNSYWADQKVPILAHVDALGYFRENVAKEFDQYKNWAREKFEGTYIKEPDETFDAPKTIEMGRFKIEVHHLGPSHSPGDTSIWLPEEKLVIAGDIAFNGRIPRVFDVTSTKGWVETWENALEPLGAVYVIPGHGHPTNMALVRRHSHDYLAYMRQKIGELIEAGGTLEDAYTIDQSAFAYLDTFEELATRNAGRIYTEMEMDMLFD